MKTHFCMNCATEQGFTGEISSYIYCERCGAKIYADGTHEIGGAKEWNEQSKENQRFYDSGYSDREKWKRR